MDADVSGDADGRLDADNQTPDGADPMTDARVETDAACAQDGDGDGTADCDDACPNDPEKAQAGVCGCTVSDRDSDGDGLPDCVDNRCGGVLSEDYVPDASCGVGYCRSTNTPSRCVSGAETACRPGAPLSAGDATCDGVDDNCDGQADEAYVATTSCGVGYCRVHSAPSSCAAGTETVCRPASPLSTNDATRDGVDDDCDGLIDEDTCNPHSETFGFGLHTLAPGLCTQLTIRLWGGGGAAGDARAGYWASTTGGQGGAGGYAEGQFTVTSASSVQLSVGQGGQGCGAAGSNVNTAYNGGAGATSRAQDGSAGRDGSVIGGTGANPSSGGRGGNGSLGAGGGGAGSGPNYAPFGSGGGGGAASLVSIGATRMLAGGGGGGGGAGTNVATSGFSGGSGGSGCSGNGVLAASQSGGGGGGGVCQGGTTRRAGTGRSPYDAAAELPVGAALGGSSSTDCDPGGNGYAVVTFAP